MSVTDKQILGSNLCNIECTEKNNIIHPETCVNQVLIGNGSTVNLPAWFDGDTDPEVHHGSFGDYSNMLAWLEANYPHNTYTLPIATNEVLGGIKVGEHLTIDSETGVLSVNLNVPSYSQATYTDLGLIKLGDNNPLPSTVGSDITIFPVQLDSVGHAGVAIPNSNLTQVNSDWTAESGSPAYIEHKPSISNAQITLRLNSASIGSFTLNQSTPSTINISLGQPLNSIQTLGTPVAANKTFVWNGFEWAYGNVNEYELQPATDQALGGIKIGYTDSGALKAVHLDGSNKAYVDVTDENLKNHVVIDRYDAVWDEYGNSFPTWKVQCQISNEILNIVNFHDFTTGEGRLEYPQVGEYLKVLPRNDDPDDPYKTTYTWKVSQARANQKICIIAANAACVKGCFTLQMIDKVKNTEYTCQVGFILDTPDTDTFAWWSVCPWNVELYSNSTTHCSYVFLDIPDTFAGTISIKDKYLFRGGGENAQHAPTWLGANVWSYNGDSVVYWQSSSTIVDGNLWPASSSVNIGSIVTSSTITVDGVDHILVPAGYRPTVDAFINRESLEVGDTFYDNIINDCVLHTICYKVQSLESRIDRLEDLVSRLNTQAIEPLES